MAYDAWFADQDNWFTRNFFGELSAYTILMDDGHFAPRASRPAAAADVAPAAAPGKPVQEDHLAALSLGNATITARIDDQFWMYVNGQLVMSGNSWTQIQQIVVELEEGDVIAIRALDWGGPGGAFVDIRFADGTQLSTSDDWLVRETDPGANWTLQTYDDSAWLNATEHGPVATSPWTPTGGPVQLPTDSEGQWIWGDNLETDNAVWFRFTVPSGTPNAPPVADETIGPRFATEDSTFSYTLSSTLFSDADGDTLALSATLADGSPLPDWLSFNPATGEFSGAPVQGDVGTISVRVTADDGNGGTATADFTLTVNNVNDAPAAGATPSVQVAEVDAAFSFTLPVGSFSDEDGDALSLTATQANGSPLPDWLSFDPNTGTFSGTPDAGDAGDVTVRVTATDPSSATASIDFTIEISDGTLDFSGSDAALVIDLDAGTLAEAARILTIGDSITAGYFGESGYRLDLWNSMVEDRGLWADFVGAFDDGPTAELLDSDHYGVGGYRVNDFAPYMDYLDGLFSPDILLVMLGTNDALVEYLGNPVGDRNNDPAVTVPQELLQLLRNAHEANPNVVILLSELPPLLPEIYTQFAPDLNADGDEIVAAINAALPGIIAQAQSEGINVALVDQSSFLPGMIVQSDGIHPGAAGDVVLAANFQAALDALALAGGTYLGTPITIPTVTSVTGSDAGDRIMGNAAVNVINGGDGNDWIEGRGGADFVTGGAGRDIFAFMAAGDLGDIIADFVSGEDRILLDASVVPGVTSQTVIEFAIDTPSGNGPAFVYNSATGQLVYDADGTGGGAGTLLAVLDGAPTLTLADIDIINLNAAPGLDTPIDDQAATEFAPFSFTLPAGTFSDSDGDALTLTATLANGNPLPSWLSFNPATGTFSGTPGGTNAGVLNIRVTATDPKGASVSDLFSLTVADAPPPPVAQDATITARIDDQFWMYVNGELVMSGNSWTQIQQIVVELEEGDVIAIRALDWGGPGGAFVDIRLEDGTQLSTSSDWLVRETDPGANWTLQGYDDSAWLNATEHGPVGRAPWTPTGGPLQLPTDSEGQWIWGDNLETDNTVWFRFTVPSLVPVTPNSPPEADETIPAQAADEDAAFSYTLSATLFSDADADTLTLTAALADGSPLPDWLSFNPATGEFSGTPEQGDVGAVTVRVTADDGNGGSVTADFTLTVNDVNDAPVAVADSGTGEENAPLVLDVLANDTDEDNDSLTVVAINGTDVEAGDSVDVGDAIVTLNANGTLTVTPDADFVGDVVFGYTVSDGVLEDDGTATATFTNVYAAPVALDFVSPYTFGEDTVTTGLNFGNIPSELVEDSDTPIEYFDASAFTIDSVSIDGGPALGLAEAGITVDANGNITVDTTVAAYQYLAEGETVNVVATFTVTDDAGLSDEGTVTFAVSGANDAPVAVDDSASTDENAPVVVDVVANDTDPEDDALVVTAINGTGVTAGESVDVGDGVVTLNVDGTLTVTPDADFHGEVVFDYTVSDGVLEDEGTVTVDVAEVNTPPVFTYLSFLYTTTVDATAQGGSATETVSILFTFDPSLADGTGYLSGTEGDPGIGSYGPVVGLTEFMGIPGYGRGSIDVISGASNGVDGYLVTLDEAAPYRIIEDWIANALIWLMDEDDAMFDTDALPVDTSFLDEADGQNGYLYLWNADSSIDGFSLTGGFTLTLETVRTLIETIADEPGTFTLDLLQDAYDGDGDDLDVANVVVTSDNPGRTVVYSVDAETGLLTLDPEQFDDLGVGEFEQITVTYQATDGEPGGTAEGQAVIVVYGSNDGPVVANAIDDVIEAQAGTAFVAQLPADTFFDVDGDALALAATLANGNPLPGWLSFDPETGVFSGTPGAGDVGTVSVRITATDPSGLSTFEDVSLMVHPAPPPVQDATITARIDDQFWMYVNGELVMSGNSWTQIQQIVVELEEGDVIAIRALDWGGPGGAFVDIELEDGTKLSTSSDWLVSEIDPGANWTLQGYDDSAWLNATEYGPVGTSPWTPTGGPVQLPTDSDGMWIWSDNNETDNTVWFRFTVPSLVPPVPNTPPVADETIPNRGALEDAPFSYTLSSTLFSDADGDDLTLSATLADGSPLPGWLSFNPATGTFSGTPEQADVGSITVRVTADDGNGGSVTADFLLTVNNANDAPVLVNAIADQSTEHGEAFSFTLPADTFFDEDVAEDGDAVSIDVRLADGTVELPDWLSYDPGTGTFSGTPGPGDVGTVSIRVTAFDLAGLEVSDVFDIVVTAPNTDPQVDGTIGSQSVSEDSTFDFTLPSGLFSDADGDDLDLTATLASGDPLPDWLSFDPDTGAFSGTPDQGDVGAITVRVTADDGRGGTASTDFALTVNNVNDAPVVANPIDDVIESQVGVAFSALLPADTFFDEDGDALALTATLANGNPLPGWLSFDPGTGVFSGTPGAGDVGTISVRITATDPGGLSTFEDVSLTVHAAPPPVQDATITARIDDQYWMYLNGELILSASSWTDIKQVVVELEAGDVIAIRAIDWGGPGGAFVDIELEDGTQLSTSSDWLVSETQPTGDWTAQDYDDGTWLNATEFGPVGTSPWTPTGGPLQLPTDSEGMWIWSDNNETDNTVWFRFTVPGIPGGGDPVNEAPVAVDDTATTDEDVAVVVDVLANDTDAEDDALGVVTINGASIGTGGSVDVGDAIVTLNANGTLTVTPDGGFSGDVSFVYEVSDGTDTDEGSVTVTVTPDSGGEPVTLDFSGESEGKVVDLSAGAWADAGRMLILGDSNTQGWFTNGGYRHLIFEGLANDEGMWVDFVGNFQTNPAVGQIDIDHSGLSGVTADQVLDEIDTYFDPPAHDVALIMLGTNDVRNFNDPVADLLANLLDIMRSLEGDNPNVQILLALVPDITADPTKDFYNPAHQAIVDAVNAALPDVVATAQGEGIDVSIVDLTGIDDAFYFDNLHFTDEGYQIVADRWIDGILSQFDEVLGTFGSVTTPTNADNVTGSQGGDRITGDAGANVIDGQGGNDFLGGGGGNDTITGGAGLDTFVINAGDAGGVATVTDFVNGEYVLLEGFGFADLTEAEAAFTEIDDDTVFSHGGVTVVFEGASVFDVRHGIKLTDDGGGSFTGTALTKVDPAAPGGLPEGQTDLDLRTKVLLDGVGPRDLQPEDSFDFSGVTGGLAGQAEDIHPTLLETEVADLEDGPLADVIQIEGPGGMLVDALVESPLHELHWLPGMAHWDTVT